MFSFRHHTTTPAVAVQLVDKIIYQLIQDCIEFLVKECARIRNIGDCIPPDYLTKERYESLLQQLAKNPHTASINIDGMHALKVCLTRALTDLLHHGIVTAIFMSANSKPIVDEIVGRLEDGGLKVKLTPTSQSLFSHCIVRASVSAVPDPERITQGIIKEVLLPIIELNTADAPLGTELSSYRSPQL